MHLEQLQKLKSLINSSLILSASEKTEWSALLELMDDKQLGELEKILTPVVSKIQGPTSPSVFPGAVKIQNQTPNPQSALSALFVVKHDIPATPPLAQIPKLSHIVNLPNLQAANWKPEAKPKPEQKPPSEITDDGKKAISFAQKLKNIFTEKELPASPDERASRGGPAPTREHEALIESARGGPSGHEVSLGLPPPTKNNVAPAAEPKASKPAAPSSFVPPLSPASIPTPKPSLAQKLPEHKPLNSGLNIEAPSQKEKDKILAQIKSNIGQSPDLPLVSNVPSKPSAPLKLETIDDLTMLDSGVLQGGEFGGLVKKVKSLMASFGYHQGLFNIEKSPLYKAYLKTGTEMLDKQLAFEQLQASDGYLSRKQFEEFADLLRQVQAG